MVVKGGGAVGYERGTLVLPLPWMQRRGECNGRGARERGPGCEQVMSQQVMARPPPSRTAPLEIRRKGLNQGSGTYLGLLGGQL